MTLSKLKTKKVCRATKRGNLMLIAFFLSALKLALHIKPFPFVCFFLMDSRSITPNL